MTDSSGRDASAEVTEGRWPRRIEAIKRWVRHVQETPPEQWGPEQNAVVNAQVEAARSAGLDADHRRTVERVAHDLADGDG